MKLVIRKIRSFLRRDRAERRLFVQALVLLPLVAASLKFLRFKRTQIALSEQIPVADRSLTAEDRRSIVVKTTQQVRWATQYCQPWANCLKKSLVLWVLLRRQGIASDLRIGVRLEEGNFEAHAWVEGDGFVLNDAPDVRQRFAMFDRVIDAELLLGSR